MLSSTIRLSLRALGYQCPIRHRDVHSDYGHRALLRPRTFRRGISEFSELRSLEPCAPHCACGRPCAHSAKVGTKGTAASGVHFPRKPIYFNTCIFSLKPTAEEAQRLNERLRGKTPPHSERKGSSKLSSNCIAGTDGCVLRVRSTQRSPVSRGFVAS